MLGVTAMTPGDRTYRNMLLRLADLTVNADVLEDVTFENCRIVGPAVLVPMNSEIVNCGWIGDIDALVWEIPHGRDLIIGAVGAMRCRFYACTFDRVGIALKPEAAEHFRDMVERRN